MFFLPTASWLNGSPPSSLCSNGTFSVKPNTTIPFKIVSFLLSYLLTLVSSNRIEVQWQHRFHVPKMSLTHNKCIINVLYKQPKQRSVSHMPTYVVPEVDNSKLTPNQHLKGGSRKRSPKSLWNDDECKENNEKKGEGGWSSREGVVDNVKRHGKIKYGRDWKEPMIHNVQKVLRY